MQWAILRRQSHWKYAKFTEAPIYNISHNTHCRNHLCIEMAAQKYRLSLFLEQHKMLLSHAIIFAICLVFVISCFFALNLSEKRISISRNTKKYSAHTKTLLICWCWAFCHLLLQNLCSKQLFKIEITIFVTMQKLSPEKKPLNMFFARFAKVHFSTRITIYRKTFSRAMRVHNEQEIKFSLHPKYSLYMCAALL